MPNSEGESAGAHLWARKRASVESVRGRGVSGVQARERRMRRSQGQGDRTECV